jgi:pimeloyl-ACP methyl ester carboxylesterase
MKAENPAQGAGKSRGKRLQHLMRRIVICACIIYAVLVSAGFVFQKRLTYFPEKIAASMQVPLLEGDEEEVWIEVPGIGRIHGIYREAPPESLTILFLPGNAGNVLQWKSIHDGFTALGAGVLLIDYPGYGKSDGSPSEAALYASAHAAVRFLEDSGAHREDIVIFGKSLGTAVATELAASGDYAGIILESPFTSLATVAGEHYWFMPVSLLLAEEYDSLSRIGQVRSPLLMVIGTRDTLIPPAQSLELFGKANEPKELFKVEGAGHMDIQETGGEAYWRKMRDWINSIPGSAREKE